MLFGSTLDEKIKLLKETLVDVNADRIEFYEKNKEGQAKVGINLTSPAIGFQNMEKHKLQYFKCDNCADYVLFQKKEEGWHLYIFELKRSVGVSTWKTVKNQFLGALFNSLALAGFLDIKISYENVHLYTCFRNDKINEKIQNVTDTVWLRLILESPEDLSGDWNEAQIALKDQKRNILYIANWYCHENKGLEKYSYKK